MKTVRYILLYTENSDTACLSRARYFHDLEKAQEAMRDEFNKQDEILQFPPSDPTDPFYNEDNNSTTATDRGIHVNMDIDSFDWVILDAVAED